MKKTSSRDGGDDARRRLVRRQHVAATDDRRGLGRVARGGGGEHRRVDAARADAGDLDALLGVGDRQPLGEPERGVLRGRVDAVAERREDAGHRRRRDEVALAACDPPGQQGPCRVDVGHHVDVPLQGPHVVGRIGTAPVGNSGVGEPQVDRPVGVLDLVHEGDRGRLVADVERLGDDVLAAGDGVGAHVGGHDGVGAGGDERPHERSSDAARGASDDSDPALGVHARDPTSGRWIRETPCSPGPVVTGAAPWGTLRDTRPGGRVRRRGELVRPASRRRAPTPADSTEGDRP